MMIRRAVSFLLAAVVVGALAASYRFSLPHPAAVTPPRAPRAADSQPGAASQGTTGGGAAQPGGASRAHAADAPNDSVPPAAALPKPPRTRDLALAKGLGPATSFASVVRGRQRFPLDARQNAGALAAVGRLLDRVGTLAPAPGGIRLFTELRLNEYLLDVTVWSPQSLDAGGTRLDDVSGILIPFTGAWRSRILIDRGGTIVASPPLPDNPDLAALERLVEASGRQP